MPIGGPLAAAAVGAGASIYGANRAASAQTAAAQAATQAQLQMFNQGKQALDPYISGGAGAFNMLNSNLSALTTPFGAPAGSGPGGQVDQHGLQTALENTPGYQFTLGQGLKSTTNALTAMGLGTSGALGRGIADYSQGLASTTFQQQFQNYLQQHQQQYGMMMGPSQLGASAGQSLLGGAVGTGGQIGSNMIGAGNAQAAATMAGTNALGSLPTNALNSYMQYSMLNRLGAFGEPNPLGPLSSIGMSNPGSFDFSGGPGVAG
jgi:hypothetical protein